MDVTDYIKQSEIILNNNEHYRQLSKDQTGVNNETVNNAIERFQKENLITKNVAEKFKINSPRTPRFSTQSIIHKQGNHYPTSNILKHVDYHH